MHSNVIQLRQVFFEALAVGAIRVGEDGDLASAGAARHRDRPLERQLVPVDGGELAQPLLGKIAAAAHVHGVTADEVLR
jgi:hypothetical protein